MSLWCGASGAPYALSRNRIWILSSPILSSLHSKWRMVSGYVEPEPEAD